MSEWLTTGQMIDRLKVGEVAEGNTHWEVKLVEPGHLVELNSGSNVVMSRDFLLEKWRILPNYVSFEEAFQEFKKGNTIWCEYNGEKDWYSKKLDLKQKEASPTFGEMVYGKWYVEADTQ